MLIDINENLKGKCLIAMPNLGNEVFNNSVVYLTEHNVIAGAVGVMINKTLTDIKPNIPNNELKKYGNQWGSLPVCFGGPVEYGTGFLLHQNRLTHEVLLTGSKSEIKDLALSDETNPLIMANGYCMWETFQLERELRFNNWLVADDDILNHLLNDIIPRDRYFEALRLIGISTVACLDFNNIGNA